ncbi:hypothetical protein LIER_08117 [Lithospermum erythrorhizon]|uniref:Uncharacterized protein n=1 Tax=Lithospermum erythrorhizon TaxID=34254 RepID=A0AAV3PCR8_LITER
MNPSSSESSSAKNMAKARGGGAIFPVILFDGDREAILAKFGQRRSGPCRNRPTPDPGNLFETVEFRSWFGTSLSPYLLPTPVRENLV